MVDNQRDVIENILQIYSIISDSDDNILKEAVMKMSEVEVHVSHTKIEQFLNRFSFSAEKPFGDMLQDVIVSSQTKIVNVIKEVNISKDILENVITHTALPNIIPIKKMLALINMLQIPLSRAIESIRVSMRQYDSEHSSIAVFSPAMRRSSKFPFNIKTSRTSRESLKRGLEAYIKRLLEAGS